MALRAFSIFAVAFAIFGVALAQGTAAETDESAEQAAAGLDFFERRVRPLLHAHCYECHSVTEEAHEGELDLDSHASVRKGGSRGPLLVPGKPDASLLIQAVRYRHAELQMPPAGKLKDAEIATLVRWVEMGAPYPKSASPQAPATSTRDLEQARQFWSFQPLKKHSVQAPPSNWSQRKIDAFIRQALDEKGLQPNPPAEKAVWIRRVTFDLIGLPPTPDEVREYLADERPDADTRLVERLLASPQYGERWARHWLDLARYTDVTASWLKSADNAWLYRDWVVAALNADVPYDDFVRFQLAADEMEHASPTDIAALGFLGLSPSYWKELKLEPALIETVVADEWEERIDAVSRTFLGLTVACAKCHDHKFDPISMRDYYGLAGVFASSQLADVPMLPEPQARVVREVRREVEALQQKLDKIKDKQSPEARELQAKIKHIRDETPGYDVPFANAVEEAAIYVVPDGPDMTRLEYRSGEPRDVPLFRRGNPRTPGEPVPRGFLEVLSPGPRIEFQDGSGRRELAEALFAEAGPLSARVFVNRIWQFHFGRGLVQTPSDFGTQGAPPTHPELLDDLAARFVEHEWSIKWLQREILLSSTYRQSSADRPDARRVDPENSLFWRMPRRKLEIEAWRDSLLFVAGQLDPQMTGPPQDLDALANQRRTIYGRVGRHELNDMLRLHDFPEPSSHSPARELTTTPLQQLFVLNSPLVVQQAEQLAKRLVEDLPAGTRDERVAHCYALLFSRKPNEAELESAEQFFSASADVGEAGVWQYYVHALVGLNEFLYVD